MSWQPPPKGNASPGNNFYFNSQGNASGSTNTSSYYPQGYKRGSRYGYGQSQQEFCGGGAYDPNGGNGFAPQAYPQYNPQLPVPHNGGTRGYGIGNQGPYFPGNTYEGTGYPLYSNGIAEGTVTNISSYSPNSVNNCTPPQFTSGNVGNRHSFAPSSSTLNEGLSQGVVANAPSPATPQQPTENNSTNTLLPRKKVGGTLSASKAKKNMEEKKEEVSPSSPSDCAEDRAKKTTLENQISTGKPSSTSSGGLAKDFKDLKAKLTPDETREYVKSEIAKQRQQDKKEYVRDSRPHFNVVFCGHVDAGKSTISGHLLMEKGLVDSREMEKLKREAAIHHREGWEYAYVMDVSEEERTKGITRETGAAYFETENRRVTVLDAPGHKAFVPSMIGGAAQADICVLVISSRTGEFETGFEKGGQTREHAMLVRTCGVRQMICVINKMDGMNWSKERYDEIVKKLRPFLKQNGYDEKQNNLMFVPVAGLTGENLIKHTTEEVCPWYTGPTIMGIIDELVLPETKKEDDVLCIPLVGGYKDDGRNYIYGKVESGSIAVGEKLQLLPARKEAVVEGISIESTEFDKCYPGDNVHLRVRGLEENDVHAGFVATSIPTSLHPVEFIQARINILEVKNIISEGSQFMLHIHSAQEEASFHKLLAKIDRKTNAVLEKNPACAKAGDVIIARLELSCPMVIECHKDFDKMGRFMIRDEGKTIAIGIVTKLYESTHDMLKKG